MYTHRRTIRKTRSFSFYQHVPIDHGTAGCSTLSNRKPILTKMASGLATKTRTVCVCVSFFPIRLFVSDSTDTGRHISVIYKTLPMHSVCDEAWLERPYSHSFIDGSERPRGHRANETASERRFVDKAPRWASRLTCGRFIVYDSFSRFPLLWVILQRCKLFLWTHTVIELTGNSSSTVDGH